MLFILFVIYLLLTTNVQSKQKTSSSPKKKKKKYCDANLCQQFAEMYFRTQSKPLRWRFKRKQSIVINH